MIIPHSTDVSLQVGMSVEIMQMLRPRSSLKYTNKNFKEYEIVFSEQNVRG